MDVLTFGESMVLFTPQQGGSLEQANTFVKRVAGAESNLAIGLARLGHQVAWLGKLGDDGFGRYIMKTLRGEGVDVSGVHMDSTRPTAVFFKESSTLYGTNVQYYRKYSAASEMTAADIAIARFADARMLHVTGITPALSDCNQAAMLEVLKTAKDRGLTISFDPNIRYKLWSQDKAIACLREMARYATIALPGLDEGAVLTGGQTPESIAAWFLEQGAKVVVVKLGAQGAYYRTLDDSGYVDGFRVTFVDEVGAGDAFAAGLLSGLLDELPIREAVRRACALGAIAVCGAGDYEMAPTRAELAAFLAGSGQPQVTRR